MLRAHAQVVNVLEDARKMLCDATGDLRDLLKQDDRKARACVCSV